MLSISTMTTLKNTATFATFNLVRDDELQRHIEDDLKVSVLRNDRRHADSCMASFCLVEFVDAA